MPKLAVPERPFRWQRVLGLHVLESHKSTVSHYELDSGSLYVGVSIDTPRKLEDAPSYLCVLFWELDTPEFQLPPTDVSVSTPLYQGCI